jgi:hypothetical protein
VIRVAAADSQLVRSALVSAAWIDAVEAVDTVERDQAEEHRQRQRARIDALEVPEVEWPANRGLPEVVTCSTCSETFRPGNTWPHGDRCADCAVGTLAEIGPQIAARAVDPAHYVEVVDADGRVYVRRRYNRRQLQ